MAARRGTTRAMSDAHEDHLAKVFGGRKTKGSGNQWHNPNDGFTSPTSKFPLTWDGKSTFDKSISVSLEMWRKLNEGVRFGSIPLIPLRFYSSQRLEVGLDLVVLDLDDFATILQAANDG